MLEMTLTRNDTGPEGTFGLFTSEALAMHTGELPWKGNSQNVSCIPEGWYLAKPHRSPKHGLCFWLQDVPWRTEILIHVANWAGDITLGYKSNLAGCIALGMTLVRDAGAQEQDMIQRSREALEKLISYNAFQAFGLTIVNNTQIEMTI